MIAAATVASTLSPVDPLFSPFSQVPKATAGVEPIMLFSALSGALDSIGKVVLRPVSDWHAALGHAGASPVDAACAMKRLKSADELFTQALIHFDSLPRSADMAVLRKNEIARVHSAIEEVDLLRAMTSSLQDNVASQSTSSLARQATPVDESLAFCRSISMPPYTQQAPRTTPPKASGSSPAIVIHDSTSNLHSSPSVHGKLLPPPTQRTVFRFPAPREAVGVSPPVSLPHDQPVSHQSYVFPVSDADDDFGGFSAPILQEASAPQQQPQPLATSVGGIMGGPGIHASPLTSPPNALSAFDDLLDGVDMSVSIGTQAEPVVEITNTVAEDFSDFGSAISSAAAVSLVGHHAQAAAVDGFGDFSVHDANSASDHIKGPVEPNSLPHSLEDDFGDFGSSPDILRASVAQSVVTGDALAGQLLSVAPETQPQDDDFGSFGVPPNVSSLNAMPNGPSLILGASAAESVASAYALAGQFSSAAPENQEDDDFGSFGGAGADPEASFFTTLPVDPSRILGASITESVVAADPIAEQLSSVASPNHEDDGFGLFGIAAAASSLAAAAPSSVPDTSADTDEFGSFRTGSSSQSEGQLPTNASSLNDAVAANVDYSDLRGTASRTTVSVPAPVLSVESVSDVALDAAHRLREVRALACAAAAASASTEKVAAVEADHLHDAILAKKRGAAAFERGQGAGWPCTTPALDAIAVATGAIGPDAVAALLLIAGVALEKGLSRLADVSLPRAVAARALLLRTSALSKTLRAPSLAALGSPSLAAALTEVLSAGARTASKAQVLLERAPPGAVNSSVRVGDFFANLTGLARFFTRIATTFAPALFIFPSPMSPEAACAAAFSELDRALTAFDAAARAAGAAGNGTVAFSSACAQLSAEVTYAHVKGKLESVLASDTHALSLWVGVSAGDATAEASAKALLEEDGRARECGVDLRPLTRTLTKK
jgi:hypothetical protein